MTYTTDTPAELEKKHAHYYSLIRRQLHIDDKSEDCCSSSVPCKI